MSQSDPEPAPGAKKAGRQPRAGKADKFAKRREAAKKAAQTRKKKAGNPPPRKRG